MYSDREKMNNYFATLHSIAGLPWAICLEIRTLPSFQIHSTMKTLLYAIGFSGISLLTSAQVCAQQKPWMLLPFVKQDESNPCLTPSAILFYDPIRKKDIAWEAKAVFNPAAVVRNDTVYLLYRAQDKIGKPAGTSRIGLAYSTDGIHFIKRETPVLYPNKDQYKRHE